jgi:nicotinate-nucleotide adenylyltransferase
MGDHMKKAAFFGGSFDPIHLGHLNLAIEIYEKLKLDKILFCPTYISPFKKNKKAIANPIDRYNMIKKAIKKIKGFEVLDIEIKQKKVSYTIDTLKKLKDLYDLKLLITEDALDKFNKWKNYKEILKLTHLIIATRFEKKIKKYKNLNLKNKNFIFTNIFEISSTEIRNRLKKNKICSHLLSKEVLDYIYKNGLYL